MFRTLLLSLLASLALASVPLGSASAPAAAALPTCPPTCTYTFTSTLRIDATTGSGTIVATDARGATAFTCPTSNDWCVHTDSETSSSPTRPTSWPSYTLSAPSPTGPSGLEPVWSTACGRAYTCLVTNDQPSQDVLLSRWADITPPTVAVSAPPVVGPSTVLTATASDNVGISEEAWTLYHHGDDSSPLASVFGPSVPSFSPARPGLAPGAYDVSFKAYDYDGNTATAWATFTLDESVSVNVSTVPAYTRTPPAITVTTDADASATCAASGPGAAVPARPCGTTFGPALAADGPWTYTVTATDGVGNTTTVTRTFTLDTVAPALSLTSGPGDGSVIAAREATFTIAESDADPDRLTCGLKVDPQTPCSDTAQLAGLADGSYVFTVHAVDKAGNSSWLTRRFTVLGASATSATGTTPTGVVGSAVRGRARLLLRVAGLPADAHGVAVFSTGHRVLCRAPVHAGQAECRAPAAASRSVRRVRVTYGGDATHPPSSGWIRVTTRSGRSLTGSPRPTS